MKYLTYNKYIDLTIILLCLILLKIQLKYLFSSCCEYIYIVTLVIRYYI